MKHDHAKGRFFVPLDGREAYLTYQPADQKTLDYTSIFMPPEQRHHKIGEKLVKHALDYAHDQGYRVIPTCPFVAWVIERNPEYRRILAQR